MMRIVGILLLLAGLLFIGYNRYMINQCYQIANDHPIQTIISDGQNLPGEGKYLTFAPPFTAVEIGTFVVMGIGALMTIVSFARSKKEPETNAG